MKERDLEEVQAMVDALLEDKETLIDFVKNGVDVKELFAREEESPAMKELIDSYMMLNLGGKVMIINKKDITEQYTFIGFLQFFSNKKKHLKVIDKHKTTDEKIVYKIISKSIAKEFLEDEIDRFKKIVFKPSGKVNEEEYNFFKGWSYSPSEKESCDKYIQHIHDNICDNDEELFNYILDWMAQIIQYPEKKEDKALVLRGKQGTGKGVMVQEFGKLIGDAFIQLTTAEPLVSRFNSTLANRLLVYADEVTWGGNRVEGNRLKTFISEDKINIEFKNKDVITMNNYARLLISSNHDWVVPVEGSDRRYVVIDVADYKKEDREYFGMINDEMKNGGREALMNLLLNRDLSKRDWAIIPKTKGRTEQKILSFSNEEQWLYDSLKQEIDLDFTPWGLTYTNVKNPELYDRYIKWVNEKKSSGYIQSPDALGKLFSNILGIKSVLRKGVRYKDFPKMTDMQKSFEDYMGLDNSIW
jgi:hypothetical protein